MKSTVLNFKSFRLAIVSFIMTGMFLFASSQVHAQAPVNSDVTVTPNGPFVNTATAQNLVMEKTIGLKAQLETYNPGTQAYKEYSVKYAFYNAILAKLVDGKTVKESLQSGLYYLGTDAASPLGKNAIIAARQEAINLLKP